MTLFGGKNVLITGGTGSFGKVFVRHLLERSDAPRRIVVYSRDEQKHVDMARHHFPPSEYPQLRYFVGDVRDLPRLERAFRDVDVVVHAAAMKHVDLAEYNPQECIHTNITGAENVIHASLDAGVERVVALSTDKAASPINLYGATKLCADKLFVAANALGGESGTRFAVVRYGNVLGSKGSVVPFFLKQREKGVLPVTDARMTRFWITLEQGVELVCRAFETMVGGEIFVPKIPSMRVVEVAKAIAPECELEFVGIRPGEKLHECLVPADEARQTIEYDDHFVIEPSFSWWNRSASLDRPCGRRCPDGFVYSSDTNPQWLSTEEIQVLLRPFVEEALGLSLTAAT